MGKNRKSAVNELVLLRVRHSTLLYIYPLSKKKLLVDLSPTTSFAILARLPLRNLCGLQGRTAMEPFGCTIAESFVKIDGLYN